MGYIIAILSLCLIPVSLIIVIVLPIIMVIKSKKERDQTNMHLFDDSSSEIQKKHSSSRWMGTTVIMAAIYLVMCCISISIPIPALPITVIISVIVLTVRSRHHKKSVEEKKQKDSKYER